MFDIVIISPHPDDEIIGCARILMEDQKPIIIYTEDIEEKRKEEALRIKKFVDIKAQFFLRSIPSQLLNRQNIFYFPDPIYETHPAHRLQGTIGEQLVRGGFDVIFYSTNMRAPYCHEVKNPSQKETLLNNVYPSQKDLWEHDKKYILFEGYYKWII